MLTNLQHTRGDTLSRVITVNVKADGVTTPYDITGATFTFSIKNSFRDTEYIFTKEWTNHSNPEDGQTLLFATATQMEIELGTYYYDVQMELDGVVTTIFKGTFEITFDVTE